MNGKQLVISKERLIRGRLALVLIAIATIQYCLFLAPAALILLPIPSVRVRRLYRRWASAVQLLLLGFLGYVAEFVCKIRLVVTGADELLHVVPAKPLLISNHGCELDWLFIVCLSLRLHRLSALKIAAWEEFTQIPFAGWLVQFFLFPSICGRDKVKDLATLRNTVEYLTGIQHPVGVTMALFPDGARVADARALEKSHRYSELMGISPKWKHVLVPRTPGLYETVRSLNRLNALDSVIDVTIGYLDFSPVEKSSFRSFWRGTYPREVHMNLNFFRWAEIPTDFDSMRDWLIERFESKEKMLERFYAPIELMYHPGDMKRKNSGVSVASSESENDDQRSSGEFSTTSTHMSNLGTLVAFSEDGLSPEPAEETLSKDMRFIQYISNSYVISAAVAMMLHCLVVACVVSYPHEVLVYVLVVCFVFSAITRWIGGTSVLELDLLPVQVDLTYSSDFYSALEHNGTCVPKGALETVRDFFMPGKRSDGEYSQRDKDNYIQALQRRRGTPRKQ